MSTFNGEHLLVARLLYQVLLGLAESSRAAASALHSPSLGPGFLISTNGVTVSINSMQLLANNNDILL